MFRTKTVFVIGAGASSELQFPIGSGLCDQIRGLLGVWITGSNNLVGGDAEICELLRHQATTKAEGVLPYAQAANIVKQGLSIWPSIDNCLHAHRENPYAVQCGKIAIARAILTCEASSPLKTKRQSPLDFSDQRIRDSYLSRLVSQIIVDQPTLSRDLFKNLAFIIFNYDRCVEEFLFHALKQAYAATEDEVADVLDNVRFVHPYGSLGRLPWQQGIGKAVPFGQVTESSDLLSIAQHIRTFTESHDDVAFLSKIQDTYSAAERIIFLGFAFNGQNMELLSGRGVPRKRAATSSIFATCYGISLENQVPIRASISESLHGTKPAGIRLDMLDEKCAAFLDRLHRVIPS